MSIEELIKELEFKYPQIKRAFGTIATFIDNLVIVYKNEAVKYLTELLNFKGRLIIVDPVYSRFTLYDNYDEVDQEAVVFEEPYNVYNIQRELLYSVASHYGIFGNSILDSLLNIDFQPASLFYLDYLTYQGRKQILILNGLLPTQITKPINLTSYNPSTLVKGNSLNQIKLKLTSGERDMSAIGLPYYPVRVFYLSTNSPVLLSRQSIINSSLTEKIDYQLESNQLVINPKDSGWLAFSQVTNTGEAPLSLESITGTGVDRLIEASTNLYYLAIDADININMFKQTFNLADVSLPNFDNYIGLDIRGDLST